MQLQLRLHTDNSSAFRAHVNLVGQTQMAFMLPSVALHKHESAKIDRCLPLFCAHHLQNTILTYWAFPAEVAATGNAFAVFPANRYRNTAIILMISHQMIAFLVSFLLPLDLALMPCSVPCKARQRPSCDAHAATGTTAVLTVIMLAAFAAVHHAGVLHVGEAAAHPQQAAVHPPSAAAATVWTCVAHCSGAVPSPCSATLRVVAPRSPTRCTCSCTSSKVTMGEHTIIQQLIQQQLMVELLCAIMLQTSQNLPSSHLVVSPGLQAFPFYNVINSILGAFTTSFETFMIPTVRGGCHQTQSLLFLGLQACRSLQTLVLVHLLKQHATC